MGNGARPKGQLHHKRPGKRSGPSAQFENARLEDTSRPDVEARLDSPPEEPERDYDEEPAAPNRPYLSLLETFRKSEPQVKRRKLKHRAELAAVTEEAPQAEPKGRASNGSVSNRTVPPEADGEHSSNEDLDLDSVDQVYENEVDDSDSAEELEESEQYAAGEDAVNPFQDHFSDPEEKMVAPRIEALQRGKKVSVKGLRQDWRVVHTSPQVEGCEINSLPELSTQLQSLGLKEKLLTAAEVKIGHLDDIQKSIAPLIFGYYDVLFNGRTVANADRLRQIVCLHVLNHIFRTRDCVQKGDRKAAQDPESMDLRYQGYTRPRVLFLLPTKNACLKMVNTMVDICQPEQQENRKRFDEGYRDSGHPVGGNKPDDYKDLFDGADDDMFRVGLKFTRKTIKFFSPFYASDVLFASPLGLRTAIGSEGDKKKKLDYDFLSSIEVVIVDHADALLMQNWDHVEQVFEFLNCQPKNLQGCDYNKVRMWYLDDHAKYYRQTIVMSSFMTPELAELMRNHCHNWTGQIKMQKDYAGMIQSLGVKAKQTFSRYDSTTIDKDPEARFNYFVSAIVPTLTRKDRDVTGTLIFIPSYLDFVRLRNYFATSTTVSALSFGAISDYTEVPKASRAISHFLAGRHRILLYTERAHHFRRYIVKGVKRVIMYGLPENPIFYREIAGEYLNASERRLLIEPGQGTVRVIFSRYDVMKLERTVGTGRVGKMIHDKGDTFDFV